MPEEGSLSSLLVLGDVVSNTVSNIQHLAEDADKCLSIYFFFLEI